MKLLSYTKMPKKYFDICEARRCSKEARHLLIIRSKDRNGEEVADEYSLCDKHLEQFRAECFSLPTMIQPEIDRARVEGRGEVVEWVHNHSIGVTAENEIKNNPLWQSKLKEWGLEENHES